MGQKTHPTGFRVGIIQKWASSWFAKVKDYREFVAEDAKIRKFVKKKLYAAGISKIWIARKGDKITITVVTAKPGIVVGRGGQGIDDLRKEVSKYIGKEVVINVVEVARIDADAQLVAENIAQQLEKRIAFRRAMKQAMQCVQVFRVSRLWYQDVWAELKLHVPNGLKKEEFLFRH